MVICNTIILGCLALERPLRNKILTLALHIPCTVIGKDLGILPFLKCQICLGTKSMAFVAFLTKGNQYSDMFL